MAEDETALKKEAAARPGEGIVSHAAHRPMKFATALSGKQRLNPSRPRSQCPAQKGSHPNEEMVLATVSALCRCSAARGRRALK
jgi:hypothetical protein